ncbi:tRNA pseudouridine 55 synthase [Sphaerochaeta pleomorpha str. Grapes]|uniref:tRNA pseudouridine synthase B n=1 Tax=Sphaerochaeta pleomorpha (strain ATCC BAA-1885 / DSM 22778 / Grapes) TaxID=158190 RepID=G8QW26_SPHPG|nr:tRNA pseudouridine(55) synthase TruB [Sphaerochaeta pleomorpha]AEV28269.1 tRNA pseudouridine 55 synthase [Sphaerochaeta pleomorpha str. Grapes]
MGNNASILLVNKPSGITSFSSLNTIKRTVDPKVGHAGTLDKFAQGLMVALTGSMTKLNVLFSTMDKRYRATICFGSETDTLDPEGEIVATSPIPSYDEIQQAMKTFIGEIEQQPPQYSALHIDGKRASALAREGKMVEMASRPVTIYSFEPVSFDGCNLVADVHVSKGTYIRSLARDLALACNSRAHLVDLVRTQIGPFLLEEAVCSDDRKALVESMGNTDSLMKRVPSLSVLEIEDSDLFSVGNGRYPDRYSVVRQNADDTYAAVYSKDGILRCVVNLDEQRIIAQIHPSMQR